MSSKTKPGRRTKPGHTVYKTTLLSPDIRNALAAVYVCGRDQGMEPKTLRKIFNDAGFKFAKHTPILGVLIAFRFPTS